MGVGEAQVDKILLGEILEIRWTGSGMQMGRDVHVPVWSLRSFARGSAFALVVL